MKLTKLGHISVDGSEFRASASRHKAMSCGRMNEAMRKLVEQVQRLSSGGRGAVRAGHGHDLVPLTGLTDPFHP